MIFAYWELAANFLLGIAWPFLFGFLAIRYGRQTLDVIKYIAENFRSGKIGPFEIIMAEKMAEATDAAAEAGISDVVLSRSNDREGAPNWATITGHPVGTIFVKYSELDEALSAAGRAHNLELVQGAAMPRAFVGRTIAALSTHGLITNAEEETLRSLRSIRNRLAHAPPSELNSVSADFADNFTRLADGMIERLKLVAQP